MPLVSDATRAHLAELLDLRDAGLLPEIEYRDCVRSLMGLAPCTATVHEGPPLAMYLAPGGAAAARAPPLPSEPAAPCVAAPAEASASAGLVRKSSHAVRRVRSPPGRASASPGPAATAKRSEMVVAESVPPQRAMSQRIKSTVASRGLKVARAPVTERWPKPLVLPYVGLGTWLIAEEEMAETVRAAYDAGYRSFDTADRMESDNVQFCLLNEEIGKGLAGKPRSSYIINMSSSRSRAWISCRRCRTAPSGCCLCSLPRCMRFSRRISCSRPRPKLRLRGTRPRRSPTGPR